MSPSAVQAGAIKAVVPVKAVPIKAAVAVHAVKPAKLLDRSEQAAVLVHEQVVSWGESRKPEAVAVAFSVPSALTPALAAASTSDKPSVPAPSAPKRVRAPGIAKAALVLGAALVATALVAAAFPAVLPAVVVSKMGALAWTGLGLGVLSRFLREPGSAPDVPRGPPSSPGGSFSSFKAAWAAARDSAAAQRSFEARVGGGSWTAFRDWLFGGMRTGLYWMAPSLLLMLGGAVVAKAGMLAFGVKAAAAGGAGAAVAVTPFLQYMTGIVPMALAAQAAGIAVYFGVEKLASKLGAGRAAPWLGGAAALGVAAAGLLTLTQAPFVIVVSLALEAGVIWTAARSRSFVAPLALRGILTVFSLEAARLGAWIKFGGATALVGLPPVWGGVLVLGLVLAAIALKSPALKLAEIGRWWKAEDPGQRPKSPGRILSAGLVWGLVVYAVDDLTYWAVSGFAHLHEPAPAILVKMLTGGVDLVVYNFIIVGLLEEYIFRRGLFKMMNEKLEKWGLTLKKAFWTAAIGSALIFSGVHYVDWGAALAWFGLGDAANSAGMGGAYAFTWAGFVARSVLGVLLAWMYKRAGFLMIPIVAHFWADTMEGLGLRWGLPVFFALAAGALLVSFLFRPKPVKSKPS